MNSFNPTINSQTHNQPSQFLSLSCSPTTLPLSPNLLHSVKGNVVETIGNATGAQSWQQSGKEEHAKGEAEYDAARAKGYAEGAKARVGGYKDSVMGAVTGDKSQQAKGNMRHDQGEAQQDINRHA